MSDEPKIVVPRNPGPILLWTKDGQPLVRIRRIDGAQEYAFEQKMEREIIAKGEERFGSSEKAEAWYQSEPLPGFGGMTAKQLVRADRAGEVLDYIDAVDVGVFMIESARKHAVDVLLDQRVFNLDAEASEAFVRVLENPPAPSEKLKQLLASRSPWE